MILIREQLVATHPVAHLPHAYGDLRRKNLTQKLNGSCSCSNAEVFFFFFEFLQRFIAEYWGF